MGGGGRSAKGSRASYSNQAAAGGLDPEPRRRSWLRSGSEVAQQLARSWRQISGNCAGALAGVLLKKEKLTKLVSKKLTKKFLLVLKRIKTKVNQTHLLNMRDLTLKLEKLSIKCPIRPRPDLRKLTKCNLCGCVLTWRHMLPRHQATTKCLVLRTSLG
jgi:hypothetical protein